MTGENERLFSEGNIVRVLIKFSIPAVLSLLVTELYNMVDTVFVGRAVGGNAIGALVVVFPIQRIVAALSMMFAIGASTSVARRNGERNREGITKTIQNALSLTVAVLVPFIALTFIFKDSILKMLGASENILPYAHDYLSIIIFGSIFICLTTVMNYIMMSLGNRKITMISTSIGASMNAIVDFILVMKLGMGVKGAAIATLVSQIVACLVSGYKFRDTVKEFDIRLKFTLDKLFITGIVTVGFSAFIVEAEDGILLAFLNNLLLNNVGDEGVIILGIISKISMFMFITMLGMGSAMQPIAAYNLGAKNYDRLREVVRDTVIFAFVTSLLLWLAMVIFAPQIISIFVTDDPGLIDKSVDAFRAMVAVFPILSIYYVCIYFYQSIGRARASFVISILRQIIIMLPVSVIMVKVLKLGAYGVWWAYPISDFISGVVAIILIIKSIREIDKHIEREENNLKANMELNN